MRTRPFLRLKLVAPLCFALLLVAAPFSSADSWRAYGARREVDPTGRWSVVLKAAEKGIGAEFTFAEAPADSAPVTRLVPEPSFSAKPPEVTVREGDAILASGALESAPIEVRVSSRGLGFAAMEEYAGVGGGVSFAWVRRDGAVLHQKRMNDLFSAAEIKAFSHTVSSVWWYRNAWIDEDAREVIIVGNGLAIRAVHVETGALRQAGPAEVKRAFSHLDPAVRAAALDVARELKIEGIDDVLAKMLDDVTTPLGVRLRTAAALAEHGNDRGKDLLVRSASTPRPSDVPKTDHEFALAHLPSALHAEAIPLLQAAMRGASAEGWSAAINGFVALGETAVPRLLDMLTEAGQSSDYRGGAAHALGKLGPNVSIAGLMDRLVAVIADPQEYVANAAANAAIAVGKAAISKELAALLDKATTQDGRLSSYFEDVKEPTAIGPLVRCLARHPKDAYPRNVILKALVFQSGVDLGSSTAAWTDWLAKQPR